MCEFFSFVVRYSQHAKHQLSHTIDMCLRVFFIKDGQECSNNSSDHVPDSQFCIWHAKSTCLQPCLYVSCDKLPQCFSDIIGWKPRVLQEPAAKWVSDQLARNIAR